MNTQSAAARRSAEAEARRVITRFAPEHERLVADMRRGLRTRLPTAHELVYEYKSWFVISYSPNEKGYDGVLGIRGDADGVRLYFNGGKESPDPDKLLKGSSQTRWIQVEAASILTHPAVTRFIDDAVARSRVPFARTGRGPVVFRSAATKQRG